MTSLRRRLIDLIRRVFGWLGLADFLVRWEQRLWLFLNHRDVIADLERERDDLRRTVQSQSAEKDNLQRQIHDLMRHYGVDADLPGPDSAPRPPLPGIILNTLPKSGSVYIGRTLANSLGIEYREAKIAHGFFRPTS